MHQHLARAIGDATHQRNFLLAQAITQYLDGITKPLSGIAGILYDPFQARICRLAGITATVIATATATATSVRAAIGATASRNGEGAAPAAAGE
ncbi:hypothetical protein NCCP2165_14630 [Halomonas sp. NCCP-2165]|nr:hypothetical protein NCCP2165_14630 [Halomonas sp. NCCP-2165]